MRFRFYILFTLFTLLFLFYPGDSMYYHLFAYHRELFDKTEKPVTLKYHPVPYLKSSTPSPSLTADGVYITHLSSFTPIYEKNIHSRLYPASTTKVITALVAMDLYEPDDVITVKQVTKEGQLMGLVIGEKITVENLLYGLLVYSGNDAAYALAGDKGTDYFVTKMNEKARELHMNDSHFADPAGFDYLDQYTTPFDLALAARELLQNKLLKKIVSTKEITVSDIDFNYFHRLSNVNKLLGEIHGLGGVKTGYTESAGENLVSFYRHNNQEFIVVILRSLDRFTDTRTAIDWINGNVEFTD